MILSRTQHAPNKWCALNNDVLLITPFYGIASDHSTQANSQVLSSLEKLSELKRIVCHEVKTNNEAIVLPRQLLWLTIVHRLSLNKTWLVKQSDAF